MMANSGVNRRVSTGAMFSMTLCLASTSHEAMTRPPWRRRAAATDWKNRSISTPMAWKISTMKPVSTPPPEGDQHVVDEELAREADEVHAPAPWPQRPPA
jgi:hypothetical protein